MSLQDYVSIVRDVGFPIAIALILLWDKLKERKELLKVIEKNTIALTAMKETVEHLIDYVKERMA